MLPLFVHANTKAGAQSKRAVITMPGVGTGEFAGDFKGKMGEKLNIAMQTMLEKHKSKLQNIACIYYDPFDECNDQTHQIGNIQYKVRPSLISGKAQLSSLKDLEETKSEFDNFELYKVVAWDHVSLPGNDFFQDNNRYTDDGVSAPATNSMAVITRIEGGVYNKKQKKYLPPKPYNTWEECANAKCTKLIVNGNLQILSKDGKLRLLDEFAQEVSVEENGHSISQHEHATESSRSKAQDKVAHGSKFKSNEQKSTMISKTQSSLMKKDIKDMDLKLKIFTNLGNSKGIISIKEHDGKLELNLLLHKPDGIDPNTELNKMKFNIKSSINFDIKPNFKQKDLGKSIERQYTLNQDEINQLGKTLDEKSQQLVNTLTKGYVEDSAKYKDNIKAFLDTYAEFINNFNDKDHTPFNLIVQDLENTLGGSCK